MQFRAHSVYTLAFFCRNNFFVKNEATLFTGCSLCGYGNPVGRPVFSKESIRKQGDNSLHRMQCKPPGCKAAVLVLVLALDVCSSPRTRIWPPRRSWSLSSRCNPDLLQTTSSARISRSRLPTVPEVTPPVHRVDGLVFLQLHRSKFTSACSPSRLVKAALEVSNALRLSCTSNAGSVPRTPRLLPCHLVLGAPRESIAMEAFWLSSPASRAAEITEATIKSERKQTRNLTAGAVATTPCLFKIIQMTMR